MFSRYKTGAPNHAGKHQGLGIAQFAARQRPRAGARHDRIDFLLDQAIERSGGARHQRDTEGACPQRLPRRPAGHGEKHADDGGKHNQADDAQFAQCEKLLAATGCVAEHQDLRHGYLLLTR